MIRFSATCSCLRIAIAGTTVPNCPRPRHFVELQMKSAGDHLSVVVWGRSDPSSSADRLPPSLSDASSLCFSPHTRPPQLIASA
jgi:hypothetical protein